MNSRPSAKPQSQSLPSDIWSAPKLRKFSDILNGFRLEVSERANQGIKHSVSTVIKIAKKNQKAAGWTLLSGLVVAGLVPLAPIAFVGNLSASAITSALSGWSIGLGTNTIASLAFELAKNSISQEGKIDLSEELLEGITQKLEQFILDQNISITREIIDLTKSLESIDIALHELSFQKNGDREYFLGQLESFLSEASGTDKDRSLLWLPENQRKDLYDALGSALKTEARYVPPFIQGFKERNSDLGEIYDALHSLRIQHEQQNEILSEIRKTAACRYPGGCFEHDKTLGSSYDTYNRPGSCKGSIIRPGQVVNTRKLIPNSNEPITSAEEKVGIENGKAIINTPKETNFQTKILDDITNFGKIGAESKIPFSTTISGTEERNPVVQECIESIQEIEDLAWQEQEVVSGFEDLVCGQDKAIEKLPVHFEPSTPKTTLTLHEDFAKMASKDNCLIQDNPADKVSYQPDSIKINNANDFNEAPYTSTPNGVIAPTEDQRIGNILKPQISDRKLCPGVNPAVNFSTFDCKQYVVIPPEISRFAVEPGNLRYKLSTPEVKENPSLLHDNSEGSNTLFHALKSIDDATNYLMDYAEFQLPDKEIQKPYLEDISYALSPDLHQNVNSATPLIEIKSKVPNRTQEVVTAEGDQLSGVANLRNGLMTESAATSFPTSQNCFATQQSQSVYLANTEKQQENQSDAAGSTNNALAPIRSKTGIPIGSCSENKSQSLKKLWNWLGL